MKAADYIEQISATQSRIEKEQIIFGAFMQGHRDLFVGAKLAYDPLISFGVKKVALIDAPPDDDPGTFTFDDFLNLAAALRTRSLTGHAARDAINEAAASCHIATWNLFY
ncbi:MAG: ATP-dependent DNA ligase, partial [Verrucomicrobiaceae bacterium]